MLHKVSEPRSPNIKEYLENKRIDFVINIPQHTSSTEKTDGYYLRRTAIDRGIPLITNVQLAKRIVEALEYANLHPDESPLIAWPDVLKRQNAKN
jgi:carbamoyl-phosphate synthase large subunit